MFEIQENYEEINPAFAEILLQLAKQKDENIEIDGKNYKIEFHLSSDYKMLRTLYGHKSANAKEGCVWCKCNLRKDIITNHDLKELEELHKTTKVFKTMDNEVKAYDKITDQVILIGKEEETYYLTKKEWSISRNLEEDVVNPGDHMKPIISFIPYENCVVDLLHLFLRISDKLFELLFWKLEGIDGNKEADIKKRNFFIRFMEFLKIECKISNPYYKSTKSDSKLKIRSLNGNERQIIFDKLFKKDEKNDRRKSFRSLFGDLDKYKDDDWKYENNVWFMFSEILKKVKQYDNIDNRSKLKDDLHAWLEFYLKINYQCGGGRSLTPYIHIFCYHLLDMLEKYKNINKFCTQSLEKLNDFCTQYYHLCSNKQNTKLLFI